MTAPAAVALRPTPEANDCIRLHGKCLCELRRLLRPKGAEARVQVVRKRCIACGMLRMPSTIIEAHIPLPSIVIAGRRCINL